MNEAPFCDLCIVMVRIFFLSCYSGRCHSLFWPLQGSQRIIEKDFLEYQRHFCLRF
jgi:hypothetical protein